MTDGMIDVTVLIIDGQSQVRDLLAERLDRQRGLAVVAKTSNPLVGADLARDWQPHVILADFRLPGKDRAESCRWLKAESPGSELVLLTPYFREGEELACLRRGKQMSAQGD
jgi:NarL family two-component system response regulator LiaR